MDFETRFSIGIDIVFNPLVLYQESVSIVECICADNTIIPT